MAIKPQEIIGPFLRSVPNGKPPPFRRKVVVLARFTVDASGSAQCDVADVGDPTTSEDWYKVVMTITSPHDLYVPSTVLGSRFGVVYI